MGRSEGDSGDVGALGGAGRRLKRPRSDSQLSFQGSDDHGHTAAAARRLPPQAALSTAGATHTARAAASALAKAARQRETAAMRIIALGATGHADSSSAGTVVSPIIVRNGGAGHCGYLSVADGIVSFCEHSTDAAAVAALLGRLREDRPATAEAAMAPALTALPGFTGCGDEGSRPSNFGASRGALAAWLRRLAARVLVEHWETLGSSALNEDANGSRGVNGSNRKPVIAFAERVADWHVGKWATPSIFTALTVALEVQFVFVQRATATTAASSIWTSINLSPGLQYNDSAPTIVINCYANVHFEYIEMRVTANKVLRRVYAISAQDLAVADASLRTT